MIEDRLSWLSGYRALWMIVMFDLPVKTKKERKKATRFRNFLLDQGFSMAQLSIYHRLLTGKEAAVRLERRIKLSLPGNGKVQLLVITDKQYENIKTYRGKKQEPQEIPEQLMLF